MLQNGGKMSFLTDWRAPVAADDLRGMERADFALEFLRRNRDYQREYASTKRLIDDGLADASKAQRALARRWGLDFCC
jgi:hypothetical protein